MAQTDYVEALRRELADATRNDHKARAAAAREQLESLGAIERPEKPKRQTATKR